MMRFIFLAVILGIFGWWTWTTYIAPATATVPVPTPYPPTSSVDIGKSERESLEKILREDPPRFLEMSLEKYAKEVKGYKLLFDKQEKINGTMHKPQRVEVHFREAPFSVHMHWLVNPQLATKALFVEGENDGKVLARGWGPLRFLGIQKRDVDGADAKNSGRYTIAQFGFRKSTERTLEKMKQARARGELHVRYLGIEPVEKLGGLPCYKLIRTPYVPLEDGGLNELTIYFDQKSWLQVGSILRDSKGDLIAEYFFSNITLNPEFDPKQFTRDSL